MSEGNWTENEPTRVDFGGDFPHFYTKNGNVFYQYLGNRLTDFGSDFCVGKAV